MFPPSVTSDQGRLCRLNESLLDFVEQNPECLDSGSFAALRERHLWIEYPLQPWPLFLATEKARRIRKASAVLAELIRSLPGRLFGNDPEQMSQHLGLEPRDAQFLAGLLEDPGLNRGLISRSDFVFGANGFRCLEVNLSKPGGLGNCMQDELYRAVPVWSRFLAEAGVEARHEDNINALLSFLFDEIKELLRRRGGTTGLNTEPDGELNGEPNGEPNGELNIVIAIGDPPTGGFPADHPLYHWFRYKKERSDFLIRRWRHFLRARAPEIEGFATLCHVAELEEKRECVYLGERRIHGVIEYSEMATPRSLFIPWMAGNLRLLNGPLSGLFSDKRLFALLSELAGSDVFSAAEREVVDTYVPWTRRLRSGAKTVFKGRRQAIGEIVEQERERMVLKAAHGSSGRNVLIGQEIAPERWRDLVQRALEDGKWVVQELVEPLPVALQNGENGWAPHRVIWGVFAFGDRPGGSFLRMQPVSSSGIVSTELGAREGLFFEIDES